jgi:murein DD-endopeptidase MepM/ murein hydrolase activator NlpD
VKISKHDLFSIHIRSVHFHGFPISRMVFLLIMILSFANPTAGTALAQETTQDGPVYIVQEGDTLWGIAQRFGVTLDDLANANNIQNTSMLEAGDKLIIPGLEGIHGELVTENLPIGETLRSLSRHYGLPVSLLARMNRVSSPAELFAGSSLILPKESDQKANHGRVSLAQGQSLLELAILHNIDPWTLAVTNAITSTWDGLPGDVMRFHSDSPDGPGALPEEISSVDVDTLPLVQGKTAVVHVTASPGISMTGSLAGHDLHFFPLAEGKYVALQGIHAMLNPGLYPLTLQGIFNNGDNFSFTQMVPVQDGHYLYDLPLTVPPETLDPTVTKPEDAQWAALVAPVTPKKMWNTTFGMPSPLPLDYCLQTNECFSSQFGSRRSYNGSPYIYFHTGLDFYGGTGTKIYAPAPGIVVFTGFLTVRGNATVINHGWGVYSAYLHQSEFLVKAGERVTAGQVIGLVGGTGRVEGPHLHWEIFVGGVQVEPLDWLQRAFP